MDIEVKDFLNGYCDFSDPKMVWILKGVVRNKDNPDKPKGLSFMRRLVMTSPKDFEICMNDIMLSANEAGVNYRVYVSLNARDAESTAFNFQKKLIDVQYGLARGLADQLGQAKKMGSLWKTELEQSRNRGTKRCLLDVDNTDDINIANAIKAFIVNECDSEVHCVRRTVSGFAISFDACDTRGLMKYCDGLEIEADLQRDSMVFLKMWKA